MSSGWPPEEDDRRWEPVRHASVVGAGHDSRGAERGYSGYARYPPMRTRAADSGHPTCRPATTRTAGTPQRTRRARRTRRIPPGPCPARTATAGSAVRACTGPPSTRRRTTGKPAPGTRSTRTARTRTSSTVRRRTGRPSTARPGTARPTSPVRRTTPESAMTSGPTRRGRLRGALRRRWLRPVRPGTAAAYPGRAGRLPEPGRRLRRAATAAALPAGRVPGSLIRPPGLRLPGLRLPGLRRSAVRRPQLR